LALNSCHSLTLIFGAKEDNVVRFHLYIYLFLTNNVLLTFKLVLNITPQLSFASFINRYLPRYNWNIVESGVKHHNSLKENE
jgi:hypothetical protein